MDPNGVSGLLDEFGRIPRLPQAEQTILEIAGYAHYEKVASNILAFFLRAQNNHNLEGIVLESLLAAAGKTVSESDLDDVNVEREVCTESRKFVDLIVETSSLVIGVENKIFAQVYNDLGEYAKLVRDKAGANKDPVLILLAVRKPGAAVELKGFQPVAYSEFFDRLLLAIGPALPTANARYVSYLLDFVRTVQRLDRRSEMPTAVREFISKNAERLAELQGQMQELQREMSGMVWNLSQLVRVDSHPSLYDAIGPRGHGGEWTQRFALCRYWDIKVPSESNLAVDVYITPSGWRVVGFRRNGSDISNLLAAKGIPSTPDEWYPYRRLCYTFLYDADLGEVAEKVQTLIDALRCSREPERGDSVGAT